VRPVEQQISHLRVHQVGRPTKRYCSFLQFHFIDVRLELLLYEILYEVGQSDAFLQQVEGLVNAFLQVLETHFPERVG